MAFVTRLANHAAFLEFASGEFPQSYKLGGRP
jgi:hypothetical protein